jgi:hypothetical protein
METISLVPLAATRASAHLLAVVLGSEVPDAASVRGASTPPQRFGSIRRARLRCGLPTAA